MLSWKLSLTFTSLSLELSISGIDIRNFFFLPNISRLSYSLCHSVWSNSALVLTCSTSLVCCHPSGCYTEVNLSDWTPWSLHSLVPVCCNGASRIKKRVHFCVFDSPAVYIEKAEEYLHSKLTYILHVSYWQSCSSQLHSSNLINQTVFLDNQ